MPEQNPYIELSVNLMKLRPRRKEGEKHFYVLHYMSAYLFTTIKPFFTPRATTDFAA